MSLSLTPYCTYRQLGLKIFQCGGCYWVGASVQWGCWLQSWLLLYPEEGARCLMYGLPSEERKGVWKSSTSLSAHWNHNPFKTLPLNVWLEQQWVYPVFRIILPKQFFCPFISRLPHYGFLYSSNDFSFSHSVAAEPCLHSLCIVMTAMYQERIFIYI